MINNGEIYKKKDTSSSSTMNKTPLLASHQKFKFHPLRFSETNLLQRTCYLHTLCLLLHNLRQLEDLVLLVVALCSLDSVSTGDEAGLVGG